MVWWLNSRKLCRTCHHPVSPVQVSFLFSDRGLPDGFRHMNGYGSHTFKLVNADGECFYCKFHYKVCLSPGLTLI